MSNGPNVPRATHSVDKYKRLSQKLEKRAKNKLSKIQQRFQNPILPETRQTLAKTALPPMDRGAAAARGKKRKTKVARRMSKGKRPKRASQKKRGKKTRRTKRGQRGGLFDGDKCDKDPFRGAHTHGPLPEKTNIKSLFSLPTHGGEISLDNVKKLYDELLQDSNNEVKIKDLVSLFTRSANVNYPHPNFDIKQKGSKEPYIYTYIKTKIGNSLAGKYDFESFKAYIFNDKSSLRCFFPAEKKK